MTSLEADGDTDSSSKLHIPPSNAVEGEESLKGNGGSGRNTTRHVIYWHHQHGEHRQSRGAGREHCRTTTPPDNTNASLALKSREEEGTNMHIPARKHRSCTQLAKTSIGDACK